jgi:hypothetical protein
VVEVTSACATLSSRLGQLRLSLTSLWWERRKALWCFASPCGAMPRAAMALIEKTGQKPAGSHENQRNRSKLILLVFSKPIWTDF